MRIYALVLLAATTLPAHADDAFVVGRQTATSGLVKEFHPTRVKLPDEPLDVAGRRLLLRELTAEMGFAMRAIPIGPPGIVLHANGRMDPGIEELKTRLYKRGISVDQGSRFQITRLDIKPDRIILDLNGGPYEKHRFLKHIEINGMQLAPQVEDPVVGSRVILLFEGPVPNISGSEVKLLLEPVLDFGVKSSVQAYAETLPEWLKEVVDQHEVLVGMTRRMVVASLGQPVMKIREHPNGGVDGEVLEEWIYGRQPQTMHFVRFRGDQVVLVKVAALGKPIEVHDKDEMNGFHAAPPERHIAMGDPTPAASGEDAASPRTPSLLKDGEKPIEGTQEKVLMPGSKKKDSPVTPPTVPAKSE